MIEKIKNCIDENSELSSVIVSVIFVLIFFGAMFYSVYDDRKETVVFSKTLTDSEKVEIFTSCYTAYEFNCLEAVKAYKKLKMK